MSASCAHDSWGANIAPLEALLEILGRQVLG